MNRFNRITESLRCLVEGKTRKQLENAIAGKFPPNSKSGRGAKRELMLTGSVAKAMGIPSYHTIKPSELSDDDLHKLAKAVGVN